MSIKILCAAAPAGACIPLLTDGTPNKNYHYLHDATDRGDIGRLAVGTYFYNFQPAEDAGFTQVPPCATFRICGHMWLHDQGTANTRFCPVLEALTTIPQQGETDVFSISKPGWSLASVTLSDKGSQGLRIDTAGPEIENAISSTLKLAFSRNFLLPDDAPMLRALITNLALADRYDIICTTGGTGLGPRDITPQVTSAIIDYPLPGFTQAMMNASLCKTPNAAISRAVAGVIGKTLIINLPGSKKAVRENLAAILPALGHALDKLNGDTTDCGALS